MATHSSVLAWRIPGMGEPGGLPSVGLHRVERDRNELAAELPTYVWFCFVSEKTDVQSVGMIAGAVTGMVAGALLIFLLVWLLIRRKDKKRYEEEERPNEIR